MTDFKSGVRNANHGQVVPKELKTGRPVGRKPASRSGRTTVETGGRRAAHIRVCVLLHAAPAPGVPVTREDMGRSNGRPRPCRCGR